MRKVLILGIGNILQSDDGLGVHVVNHISQSEINLPQNVEVIDGGTAGFDLIPIMQGYEKIVIVDALKYNDKPGSIYRFKPEHANESRSNMSLHEMGIMEVINLMKIMGMEPDIEFVGIIPEDINTFNISISQAVKNSIPRAVEEILDAATN